VDIERTDVSEESITSIIRVQLLVTVNAVSSPPNLISLTMEVTRQSETSVLTRATWHHLRTRYSGQQSLLSNGTEGTFSGDHNLERLLRVVHIDSTRMGDAGLIRFDQVGT
jgi:hypothetical protein